MNEIVEVVVPFTSAAERPVAPWYSDGYTCSLCGADGHTALECPLLRDDGEEVWPEEGIAA